MPGAFSKKKVGEASYNSSITLHPEKLPVSVDIMGSFPLPFSLFLIFPFILSFFPLTEKSLVNSCTGMRWHDI